MNCGITVCYFPDDSCCAGYSATVSGTQHICGPQPNYTTPYAPYDPTCTDNCCPETGIWSDWTSTPNQCRDYCGSCGNQTRTRTCTSDADGCPCQYVITGNDRSLIILFQRTNYDHRALRNWCLLLPKIKLLSWIHSHCGRKPTYLWTFGKIFGLVELILKACVSDNCRCRSR